MGSQGRWEAEDSAFSLVEYEDEERSEKDLQESQMPDQDIHFPTSFSDEDTQGAPSPTAARRRSGASQNSAFKKLLTFPNGEACTFKICGIEASRSAAAKDLRKVSQ